MPVWAVMAMVVRVQIVVVVIINPYWIVIAHMVVVVSVRAIIMAATMISTVMTMRAVVTSPASYIIAVPIVAMFIVVAVVFNGATLFFGIPGSITAFADLRVTIAAIAMAIVVDRMFFAAGVRSIAMTVMIAVVRAAMAVLSGL